MTEPVDERDASLLDVGEFVAVMTREVLRYGLPIVVPATLLAVFIHPTLSGGLVQLAARGLATSPDAVRPIVSPFAFVLAEVACVLAVFNWYTR